MLSTLLTTESMNILLSRTFTLKPASEMILTNYFVDLYQCILSFVLGDAIENYGKNPFV